MQAYSVKLQSLPSKSFRCNLAAQSLDIDLNKKLTHELNIIADINSEFKIGLIIGASGSGKTTLAKSIYGDFEEKQKKIDESKTILDQMNESLSYDECSNILNAVGLSQVPCWLKPISSLSNGQRSRANIAFLISHIKDNETIVIDEWTSVVDRQVAKAMSNSINKYLNKLNKNKFNIVFISCHYDITDWLNPDWIIDCNEQKFIDRRLLRPEQRARSEQIKFDIRECKRESWRNFSKYHYLSDQVPGGKNYYFGLYLNNKQIGFQCFSNYVPKVIGKPLIYHSNRTVIHPDYVGLSLGVKLINETSRIMKDKYDYKIMAKFSSIPVYKSLIKSEKWKLIKISNNLKNRSEKLRKNNQDTFRKNIKTFSFLYVG